MPLQVMVVLKREFATPDEEMKKIVLKVVKQCVGTEGVEPDYIRTEILPEFFKSFWNRRMALDRCAGARVRTGCGGMYRYHGAHKLVAQCYRRCTVAVRSKTENVGR